MSDFLVYVNRKENVPRVLNSIADGIIVQNREYSSGISSLTREDIREITDEVHSAGRKIYVRADRLFCDRETEGLKEYLEFLNDIGADGVIFSDISVHEIIRNSGMKLKDIYAPETLLTNSYDIRELQNDGVSGCVISKDVSLREAYEIVNEVRGYCYIRIHGPILLAYSRRHYISDYLQKKDEYTDGYYIIEETRDLPMRLIDRQQGSWLYGPVLQSFSEIRNLLKEDFRGFIIDNGYLDDEYTLRVLSMYEGIINGNRAADPDELAGWHVVHHDINEVRETWLLKERDND